MIRQAIRHWVIVTWESQPKTAGNLVAKFLSILDLYLASGASLDLTTLPSSTFKALKEIKLTLTSYGRQGDFFPGTRMMLQCEIYSQTFSQNGAHMLSQAVLLGRGTAYRLQDRMRQMNRTVTSASISKWNIALLWALVNTENI